MIKQGGGTIINTASVFGTVSVAGALAYCASKGGVMALTRALALELAPYKIRVNCICPGSIKTPRFRGNPPRPAEYTDEKLAVMAESNRALLRVGYPEEVAYGVLFLASDESSFVTGHPLVIDGGQTIDA